MKKLILILSALLTIPAYSKSVTMTVNGKVITCPKKGECSSKNILNDVSIELSALPGAGLDYGLSSIDYRTPSQKFSFKAIASSLTEEKSLQIMFAIFDQDYKYNHFILDVMMPEELNAKLTLISPSYIDSNGTDVKVQVEVSKIQTQL